MKITLLASHPWSWQWQRVRTITTMMLLAMKEGWLSSTSSKMMRVPRSFQNAAKPVQTRFQKTRPQKTIFILKPVQRPHEEAQKLSVPKSTPTEYDILAHLKKIPSLLIPSLSLACLATISFLDEEKYANVVDYKKTPINFGNPWGINLSPE